MTSLYIFIICIYLKVCRLLKDYTDQEGEVAELCKLENFCFIL